MQFKKRCFLLLMPGLLCFSIAVLGQYGFNSTPQVVNFTKQSYNAHSQNWSLSQDNNGLIYVANNNGLLSFDGSQWTTHKLPGNPIVRAVATDANNRIYTGAYGEFGYWQQKDRGPLVYHSLGKLVPQQNFAKEEIWKINTQSDGILFQSFSKLYRYKDDRITQIELPGNIMYLFSIRGKDYIQVLDHGIYIINRDNSISKISGSELFNGLKVISIVPFINNTLLIGTVKSGFYVYDGVRFTPWNTPAGHFIQANDLNAGIRIDDNRYAFGTIRNGIIICDAQGNIQHHINRSNGLQNNTVLNLFKDRMGNLWAGMDKGIDEIVINSGLQFFKDVHGNIGAIYTASLINDNLYIGSNQGLFHTKVNSYNPFTLSAITKVNGINEQVWDLSFIDNELICGNNNATYRIEGSNIYKISDVPGGWNLQKLAAYPNYLVQGSYIGPALYNYTGKGWAFYRLLDSTGFIPSRKIIQQNKNLWIEHANAGIYVLQLSDSLTTASLRQVEIENSDKHDARYSLFSLEGNVYLASSQGIFEYDSRQNKFILSERLKSQLGTNFYANKVIGNTHNLWYVLGNNTLALVNKAQGNQLEKISWVQANFSLVNNYENILQLKDNLYFICGEEGFVIYDRNYYKGDVNETTLFIRQIRFTGKGHTPAVEDPPGSKVSYKNNTLQIVAAHPVFDRDVLFRYSLTRNADDTLWSSWTKSSEREVNNLLPGQYSLKVQSNQSDKIVDYRFTILNPWYTSVVAVIIYILLLLLIAYGIYYYVNWRVKRQNEYMRLQHERKLQEEKRKVEHLTLLQHQKELEREVIIKSEDVAKSAMKLIKNKKALQKLKTELNKLKAEGTDEKSHYQIQKLSRQLDRYISDDQEERSLFENGFSKVHEDFFNRLLIAYPQLTPQDLKLAAYLRMNLSSKEIAPLINISTRGVEIKRYRLRKKLNLDSEANLNDFMMKF